MLKQVHPWELYLRGDKSFNARDVQVTELGQGLEELTGIYRDDGVREQGAARRPDRPFRFILHRDADYTVLNMEIFRRLQSGESLLDFKF